MAANEHVLAALDEQNIPANQKLFIKMVLEAVVDGRPISNTMIIEAVTLSSSQEEGQ